MDIENVLCHYIAAALWSTDDDNDVQLETNFDYLDVDAESLQKMREDVTKFVEANEDDLFTWEGETTTAEEQAGHDFWLNRNGHGCGFWEPEWGDPGKRLDEACKAFGECWLYVGDDGKIHLM